jgi:hypothetical protein
VVGEDAAGFAEDGDEFGDVLVRRRLQADLGVDAGGAALPARVAVRGA